MKHRLRLHLSFFGVGLLLVGCCAPCTFRVSWVPASATYPHAQTEEVPAGIQTKVAEYLDAHPETSPLMREQLLKARVIKKMTKAQVGLLLGEPDLVRTESGAEVWVYYTKEKGFAGQRYLALVIIPIPVGKEHWKVTFTNDTVQKLEFASWDCL